MNFECHWRAGISSAVMYLLGEQLPLVRGAPDVLMYTAGVSFALFFSPDLDVDAGVQWMRRSFVGRVFRLLCWPYAKLLPHRSFFSHAPFISTAIRMVFLFPFPTIVFFLGGERGLFVFFLGAAIADLSHILLDIL